jgi:hypothetical protein
MSGAIPLLPQYAFTAWYLVKHRDNLTFYTQVNYFSYVYKNLIISLIDINLKCTGFKNEKLIKLFFTHAKIRKG